MYYKNSSSEQMEDLLSKWIDLLDIIQSQGVSTTEKESCLNDMMKKMITGVYQYGSSKTVRLLVEYQQLNYEMMNKNDVKEKQENETGRISEYYAKQLVLHSMLLASLKKDFTGYEIPDDSYLKLKLNDYKKNKIIYDKIIYELNNKNKQEKFK